MYFGLRCICINIQQVTRFDKDFFNDTLFIVIVILFFFYFSNSVSDYLLTYWGNLLAFYQNLQLVLHKYAHF